MYTPDHDTLIDDIGSFPLPRGLKRELFNEAYVRVRDAIIKGVDLKTIKKNKVLYHRCYKVIINSYRMKLKTDLDAINYPQHYDMRYMFLDLVHKAMEKGTFLVEEKDAIIPEVIIINKEAKRLSEEYGKKIPLRVCITDPIELYLKQFRTPINEELLLMFAETVRKFAKNSILNSKYIETVVISDDVPSLGITPIDLDTDILQNVLETTLDFTGPIKQIHLHSPLLVREVLEVENLDVLSFEYGASPQNIKLVSKNMLEKADKKIRVGVSRTDVDSILAELYEVGIEKPTAKQLVESEEIIRKRFKFAKEKYGEIMTFTGPDCGLDSWPTQEAAQLLLRRTINAVKSNA